MSVSAVPVAGPISAAYVPMDTPDLSTYLEKKMAAMMILMLVLLVMPGGTGHMRAHSGFRRCLVDHVGPGGTGHMRAHSGTSPPEQHAQSYERNDAKPVKLEP